MCIPVVKSRWRVRHWSAPDRMVSSSTASENHYNGDNEESTIIDHQVTISDSIQPPNMVQNQCFFEDDLNEIISPVNSCSKSCKADNYLYDSSPLLNYSTTIGGYDKTTVDKMSNMDEKDSQTRSQETTSIDERIKDDAIEPYQSCIETPIFHPTEEIKFVREDTRTTRKRHASCPVFSDDNVDDLSDVSICHEIDGGPSSNLLPVQSMILMLLLQRRQSSQDISPELNTARRNESTARMTTSRKGSALTTPRHNLELRKLINLFPHYNKNQPPNCRKLLRRHSLAKSMPSCLYYSPSSWAHGLKVPDVNIIEDDLGGIPPIQPNIKTLLNTNKDLVVDTNEMTDQTRNLESSSEINFNCQTTLIIGKSEPELKKRIQDSRAISTIDPACRVSKSKEDDMEKVTNKLSPNSIKDIHEQNGLELEQELELDTKLESTNTITNSISLQYQISNSLSNSFCCHPQLQDDSENSSSFQVQYNHKRCLKTVSDNMRKKCLFHPSTSPSSNLASNVYWNGNSNKNVIVAAKEVTLSIPENSMSNDCQTLLPVYQEKIFEFSKSEKIHENDNKNNPKKMVRMNNIAESLNNRFTPPSGPMLTSSKNRATILNDPQPNLTTQQCKPVEKNKRNKINRRQIFGMSPIFVSLIMLLMTNMVTCGEAKILKDPGIYLKNH